MELSSQVVENEATRTHRLLPWYRRFAFGTGHVLHVLAAAMWFPYDVTFYQEVLQLSPGATGWIILAGQLAGAISTPFVGIWSDQTKCPRFGRRKIFHLLGVVAAVFSVFFIWHSCFGCQDAPEGYQILYFSSFAAVFQFGWAAAQIAQLSLIPELTNDKNVKVELNSIRYAFSMLSFLIVFVCMWILLAKLNQSSDLTRLSPSDEKIFWIMALIVTVVGLAVTMTFQILVREDPDANPPKMKWSRWIKKAQFYLVACAFVTGRILVFFPQTYLPLYLIDTLNMDRTSIAKGPLILFISSFITTLVMKRVNKYIGTKMTYFLGLAIVWGALIWFWLQPRSDDPFSAFNAKRDSVYGAIILLGVGSASVMVIGFSMVAYLVGSYSGSSAFVYGWMLFGDRLFNGIIVKIVQNEHPGDSPALQDFYRHVLVFTCFAASAIGLATITSMLLYEKSRKNPAIKLFVLRLMLCCTRMCTRRHYALEEMENTVSIQVEDTDRQSRSWICFQCCTRRENTVTVETPYATPDPLLTQSEDSDSALLVLTDENT